MIEKAREDLETNIRSSAKLEWTIEAEAYIIYHEASVTSYVYEIRQKIRGPFDGC